MTVFYCPYCCPNLPCKPKECSCSCHSLDKPEVVQIIEHWASVMGVNPQWMFENIIKVIDRR